MKIISSSPEETKKFAAEIIQTYPLLKFICLSGNLGSGKTTFSQGIGEYFDLGHIQSPTYTYMREYKTLQKTITHIDLYRLNSLAELQTIGYEEALSKSDLVIIEWAEKLGQNLPLPRVHLTFSYQNESSREITVKIIS